MDNANAVEQKWQPETSEPKKSRLKTEITDDELTELIFKYGNYFSKKFKHDWKLYAAKEDIIGELSVTACEARNAYKGTANIKTFLISAFRRRMNDYRKYLYVRQVKYRMARLL